MTVVALKPRRRVPALSTPAGLPDVRETLTAKRQREASEVAEMMVRMVRALRRRAASGDLEALRAFVKVQVTVKVEMRLAACALHDQHGYSWTEIGWAAGITRQSAQERWGG